MNREIRLLCGLLFAVLVTACASKGSVDIGDGQAASGGTTDFGIAYIKRTLPTGKSSSSCATRISSGVILKKSPSCRIDKPLRFM